LDEDADEDSLSEAEDSSCDEAHDELDEKEGTEHIRTLRRQKLLRSLGAADPDWTQKQKLHQVLDALDDKGATLLEKLMSMARHPDTTREKIARSCL